MSNDNGRQLIDQLEKDGKKAILVTYTPSGPDGDFVIGDDIRIQSSDSLNGDKTATALLAIAVQLNEHVGLLPKGFLKGLADRGES